MPVDYKKYPPNWKTEIRPAIMARAGNKCECCKRENKSEHYSVRLNGQTSWFKRDDEINAAFPKAKLITVVLTVAHLDHDESNHNVKLDRLKAMCQLCHLRYDTDEKKRRRKLTNPAQGGTLE